MNQKVKHSKRRVLWSYWITSGALSFLSPYGREMFYITNLWTLMLGIGQGASDANKRSSSPLPRLSSDILLQHLSELLLQRVNFILQKKAELTASLPYLFFLSGLLAYCIFGVEHSILRRWDWLHARSTLRNRHLFTRRIKRCILLLVIVVRSVFVVMNLLWLGVNGSYYVVMYGQS